MPRRKRTRRLPSAEYGEWHRRQLLTGFSFKGLFGPDFGYGQFFDRSAARAAWEVLREELLREHIAERPCYRPWAWWHLESRELRRRVDGGVHPCEDESKPCTPYYGVPQCMSTPDEFEALYESVPAYLLRLRLLTKREREYLDENPELLDPVYAAPARGWE